MSIVIFISRHGVDGLVYDYCNICSRQGGDEECNFVVIFVSRLGGDGECISIVIFVSRHGGDGEC